MTDLERFEEMMNNSDYMGGCIRRESCINYEGEKVDTIELVVADHGNMHTIAVFSASTESFITFIVEEEVEAE